MDAVARVLSRDWWLFLLQGILGIVIGVLALVWPHHTLAAVIILFGLLTLIGGVIEVIGAIGAAGNHQAWAWRLALGIFGILAGLAILRWPSVTALIVLYLVALWAIITGVIRIVGAIDLRDMIPHAWVIALIGVISVLFGIAMFVWPPERALTALVYVAGIYAIVYGVMYCLLAFEVRRLPERIAGEPPPPHAMPAA
jgi:uncharacterized membrane protein HdeD (DUF308 family)